MTTTDTPNFIEELHLAAHVDETLDSSHLLLNGGPWCECCGERFDGLYTPTFPHTGNCTFPDPDTGTTVIGNTLTNPSDLGQRDCTVRSTTPGQDYLISPHDIRFTLTP